MPNPLQRRQVHLPPTFNSDFVVHYRNTDYHVHTFVLHHHSQYFRHYFDSLQPLAKVEMGESLVEGQTTCRVTAFPSSLTSGERSSVCHHSPLIHCIDLPDSFGIHPACEELLDSFLYHLYFASTLHCPPFQAKAAILTTALHDGLSCLNFPTSSPSDADIDGYAEKDPTGRRWLFNEELLSLCHYFACEAALKRCEAVIVTRSLVKPPNAWFWLPLSVRYGLRKAEAVCIARVTVDQRSGAEGERYQQRLAALDTLTRTKVMDALLQCSTTTYR